MKQKLIMENWRRFIKEEQELEEGFGAVMSLALTALMGMGMDQQAAKEKLNDLDKEEIHQLASQIDQDGTSRSEIETTTTDSGERQYKTYSDVIGGDNITMKIYTGAGEDVHRILNFHNSDGSGGDGAATDISIGYHGGAEGGGTFTTTVDGVEVSPEEAFKALDVSSDKEGITQWAKAKLVKEQKVKKTT